MMPFPSFPELPAFTGDEIAQIWLDPWGLRFLFGSKIQLYVEYRIEHIEADGTIWLYDTQAEKKAPLVLQRLLYKKIISFNRGDLRLIPAVLVFDLCILSVMAGLDPAIHA